MKTKTFTKVSTKERGSNIAHINFVFHMRWKQ